MVYSQIESEVIEQNPDLNKALTALPGYKIEEREKVQVNLYERSYVDWELECELNSYSTMNQITDD